MGIRNISINMALAGLLATAAPFYAQDDVPPPVLDYQLSEGVREATQLAQAAIQQNNLPAVPGYLSQALAAAQTVGDRYVIASIQLDMANWTFNIAGQATAINTLLANPLITADYAAELYYHRARLAYHAQNVEAARADLQTAIDRGTANPRIYIALASLNDDQGNHAGALALAERAMEIHRIAGVPIPVDWYRRAIHFSQELNDSARIMGFGQSVVAEHPNQRNWRDTLIQHRAAHPADPEAALDLWRLQDAVGALTGEFDYRDYAQVAHGRALPGEIERVIQAGRVANMLNGNNAEIAALDRGTTRRAQSLRAALPGRAQSAASVATGSNALAAANDYLSLGDYAAAIPLYRLAIEKDSVDSELAALRLGMALTRTGDLAGARTVFDQVAGSRAPVARLWRIFADQPRPAPMLPTSLPVPAMKPTLPANSIQAPAQSPAQAPAQAAIPGPVQLGSAQGPVQGSPVPPNG